MRVTYFQAILFDMDGTLVDSTICVEAMWKVWAERHNIELERILVISHGRRTIDTMNEIAPHLDTAREAELFTARELVVRDGIQAVAGAVRLLAGLSGARWAVVTSAGRELTEFRMQCAGLPMPAVMVCAEDVKLGKPDPAGYRLAAERLGVDPGVCLVIEDTPSGIRAGRAAGMRVLAVTTTYPADELLGAECVADFRELEMIPVRDGIEVRIPDGGGAGASAASCL